MRARRRNSTYIYIHVYIYVYTIRKGEVGGRKERGEGAQLLSRLCDSFVSRNASFFFPTVRVLFFNCKRISILYKSMS